MNNLEKIALAETITEWIGLNDHRLEMVTGESAPNHGSELRESWGVVRYPFQLVSHVSRLIVPSHVELRSPVKTEFESRVSRGQNSSNVVINFATEDDWLSCFPLGETAKVPEAEDLDFYAWGAVAMCGETMGLAVFAMEDGSGVRTNVQPVSQDKFEALRLI